jgi:hypothetical protein
MTPQEFINWLQGFTEAISTIENHHLLKIKERLKEVNNPLPDFSQGPKVNWVKYDNPKVNLVQYHTICSCNPTNGGSGMCGCIMGNKMIDTNVSTKTNVSTTFNIKDLLKG